MKTLFFRKNKLYFAAALFAVTVESALYVAVAFFIKGLMDVAAARDLVQFGHMMMWIAVLIPLYAADAMLKRYAKNRFLERAACQYKEFYFEQTMQKGISVFQRESTSAPLSALTNDFTAIEGNLLEAYLSLWNCFTQLVFGLASMIWLNWVLTLAILLAGLLPVAVSLLFAKKQQRLEREVSAGNERFVAFLKDILAGFAVIKSFRAEQPVRALFQKNNARLEAVKRWRRDSYDLISIFAEIASLAVNVIIFLTGALLAVGGYLTVSTLAAFFQLLNNVIGPLQQFSPLLIRRKAAEALLQKAETSLHSTAPQGGIILNGFQREISCENLSFCYEGSRQPALSHVHFCFEKGKSYALVGASGSGKSTLLNLIRQYSGQYGGSLRIDGTEVRDICPDSLCALISVIQQNVFVFDDTIRANITLYQDFSEAEIQDAVRKSGLDRLIAEKGAEYRCGENGANLSGGEKQRISIARSLLRKAPVLLMDEATAALDAETSRTVEEAILHVEGLTRIVVTHKLVPELLEQYDAILVMDRGALTEIGGFSELYEQKGIFYSLCRLSGIGKK